MKHEWPPGAKKDRQTVDRAWGRVGQALLDGVLVKEVLHVPKDSGMVTEVFRRDWFEGPAPVDQVFQTVLQPGAISAWHAHARTTDRLFVNFGMMLVALYDGRPGSPTYGRTNEFRIGSHRPTLIVIPPLVWHGVANLSDQPSLVLNLVDAAYCYEDPDHWRLPLDTPEIPFRFPRLKPLA